MADQPTPRDVLELMARTDHGDMTVWSPAQVRDALDAYEAQQRAQGVAEAMAVLTTYADTGYPCVSYDGRTVLDPAQLRYAATLIADRTTNAHVAGQLCANPDCGPCSFERAIPRAAMAAHKAARAARTTTAQEQPR